MRGDTMTPMQRTLTTLGQREPDRVPLFLMLTMHGAPELGLDLRSYFGSAEHLARGQMRMLQRYGGDCLYGFFHAALEHEAWGGETIYRDDGPPNAGAPVITRDDQIDTLQPPRVADAKVLHRALEAQRLLKAEVGDTVPIIGVVMSPFSLPVMQMGFDRYLLLMHEQPERHARLMQANEAFCIEWGNAQLAAGATAICYFDPVASSTIVPAEIYRRAGKPSAQRVLATLKGPVATGLASGRCLPVLDDLVDTGTVAVGVSTLEDLGALKAAAADRVALMGNLNGIEMRRWTPQQAETEVRRAIARGAPGGGFVLSDNHGEIPLQVPPETVHAIAEAVRVWGHYPLRPDVDPDVDPEGAAGPHRTGAPVPAPLPAGPPPH